MNKTERPVNGKETVGIGVAVDGFAGSLFGGPGALACAEEFCYNPMARWLDDPMIQ